MQQDGFTSTYKLVGRISARIIFVTSILYLIVTGLGFLSLKSSLDTISDPYFSIMELLMILMASLMVVCMVAVQAFASPGRKEFASIALIFMIVVAVITSCVHFAILTVGQPLESGGMDWVPFAFSFKWPSVCYALDILAWDWFFGLSMLFCAPVFRTGKLENALRILMLISGILCLVGLLGIPLANMQIRNIGILGYGVVAPVIFLLLSFVFSREKNGI